MATRSGSDPIILAVLFVAAIIADGFVLYFIETPGSRLLLGLLVLLPILWPVIWATRRLGKLGLLPKKIGPETHKRRFHELRKHTEALLAEVSRLNWIAVDKNRGYKTEQEVADEFRAIEQRMVEIVHKMPAAAGHIADDEAASENPASQEAAS